MEVPQPGHGAQGQRRSSVSRINVFPSGGGWVGDQESEDLPQGTRKGLGRRGLTGFRYLRPRNPKARGRWARARDRLVTASGGQPMLARMNG